MKNWHLGRENSSYKYLCRGQWEGNVSALGERKKSGYRRFEIRLATETESIFKVRFLKRNI
jgi:hypothetical protein